MKYLSILLFSFAISFFHCVSPKLQPESMTKDISDFDANWAEIDSLERKGLYDSALTKLDELQAAASEADQKNHVIKALFYKGKYFSRLKEDSAELVIQQFENALQTEDELSYRKILHSILGELYFSYASQNQFKIQQRTGESVSNQNDENDKDSMQSWTLEKIIHTSNEHYRKSVEDISIDNLELSNYEMLLNPYTLTDASFDLYSLLLSRAITHFENDRNLLTEPVYAFVLNNEDAFSPARTFIDADFSTEDIHSYKAMTIGLYQKILSYHQNDNVLYRLNIERLEYMRKHYVPENKNSLYRKSLENIKGESPYAQLALARLMYQQNDASENNEAYRLAQGIMAADVDGELKQSAQALIQNMEYPTLNISIEEVYMPNEKALFNVMFKNLDQVKFSVKKITQEEIDSFQKMRDRQEQIDVLKALDAFTEWNQAMPNTTYTNLSSELLMPELPVGKYVIIADSGEIMSFRLFTVSNIAYTTANTLDGLNIIVTNRKTGFAQANVEIEIYKIDYRNRRNEKITIATLKTDSNGFANYRLIDRERVGLKFRHGEDELQIGNTYSKNGGWHTENARIYTFTDRNIYRPNQRVYVKSIVVGKEEVLSDQKLTIYVRDYNGRLITELSRYTNEFGSLSFDFMLPKEGLAGNYSIEIRADNGSASGYTNISVEEYKRPTFFGELDQPDHEYKLGDELSLNGRVLMYSGPAVSNATIEYRITRNQYFNYYFWSRPRGGQQQAAEIDFGTTTSNSNGEFKIDFTLREGQSSYVHRSSRYTFNIEYKVTDISGETQIFNEQVKVSRQKTFLSTNIKDKLTLKELDSISVYSKNINDIAVLYSGKIKVYALDQPTVFKRKKYWNTLDSAILSDQQYEELLHEYKLNEHDIETWSNKELVFSSEFETSNGEYVFSLSPSLPTTYYRLIITSAETGEEELSQIIKVSDIRNAAVNIQDIYNYELDQEKYIPGENVKLAVASVQPNVRVFYQLEKNELLIEQKWIQLGSGFEEITIPIKEADENGFVIHLTSFFQNRFKQDHIPIKVENPKKILKLHLESFKSSLEPGSEEEWIITVRDHKGENVTTEVLASMYDASLDAFKGKHRWQSFAARDYFQKVHYTIPGYNLIYGQLVKFPNRQQGGSSPHKYYPSFNTFGYHGGVRMSPMRAEGRMMKSRAGAPTIEMASSDVSAESYDEVVVTNENEQTLAEDVDWGNVRSVLDETVFFFPELVPNESGEIALRFKMSDALSAWTLQLLGHDKDTRFVLEELDLKTIKELAVYPNVPRFLRVDDQLTISGKVINSSEQSVNPEVTIQFIDPATNEDVTTDLLKSASSYPLSIAGQSSKEIAWQIDVSEKQLPGLIYRMKVSNSNASDVIEGYIPVVTNQVFITESQPLFVKAEENETFTIDDLERVVQSEDANLTKYTVEFTSNPSWYVMQALPFMSNPNLKSADNLLSQYVANSIGKSIAEAKPELGRTIALWIEQDSDELKSQLQKNADLKMSSLESTPWLRQSQTEAEQKRELIKFFSENDMQANLHSALTALLQFQNSDGGFSWLPNRPSNAFISSNILEQIGRMNRSHISHDIPDTVLKNLIQYIDEKIDDIAKAKNNKRTIGASKLQLLYARSFFLESHKVNGAFATLVKDVQKNWLARPLHEQAMIASISNRYAKESLAKTILESLQEQLIQSEDKGSYWKLNRNYYSNHSTIDKHVMLLELFVEMNVVADQIDQLRIWLLRNKHTNHWKTSKSTAAAVYAFMIHHHGSDSDWIKDAKPAELKVGNTVLSKDSNAGTLYSRTDFDIAKLDKNAQEIEVKNPNVQPVWGSAYIQYYDDIKNVQESSISELSVSKELFKKVQTATGPILESIAGKAISPGDKLVVKVIVENDRPLEYVHIKDERATGLEPVDVLSGFQYQDALSYYQVTQDDGTHFYVSFLPRGTHVLEYELVANLNGSYSSGMTTVQCIYAPEFISHSNTIQVEVGE